MDDKFDFLSFTYLDAYGHSRRKSVCLRDHTGLASFIHERWLEDHRALRWEIVRYFDDVVQIKECVAWLDTASRWIRVL